MRFAEVARIFAELESTTSRRKMVELVAELLRRAGPERAGRLVYLLQGRLRPPYEGVEIGVGERMLIATLVRAYSASAAALSRRLARLGDLGLVAEGLAPPARGRLTLDRVYGVLLALARTGGAGSVARKTERLADLLRRAEPLEARFLARIAQGKLRLGVGDQTILEAAALAALGDRKKKALVEHAYNVRADLGAVVHLALARGARGLEAVTPAPGVPVRPALAQRLPSAEAIVARLGTAQVEPKYDGFRLQLHRDGDGVRIFSRRLDDVTGMFPDLAAALRRQLRVRRAIIEGEAVAHNPETGEFLPFQVTITRKRKRGIARAAERYPLRLFAFDLLYEGRRGCLAWPQRRRSAALRRLLRASPDSPIVPTEAVVTRSPKVVQATFDEMIQRGLEGIVAKRPEAPYQAGARGWDWVKLKRAYQSRLRDTVDVVLVGYSRGRGKRASLGIGSLLGASYDPVHDRFRTVARIGSGLTEAAWKELRARLDRSAARTRPRRVDSRIVPDRWVAPRIVVEVLADEITRSPAHTTGKTGVEPGYALRFPRILSERVDKAPEDATTEREILQLYRQQRRPRGARRTR